MGARYLPEHNPPYIDLFAVVAASSLNAAAEGLGIPKPKLIVEPGRAIVAEAGVTLYTVGPVKDVNIPEPPGRRTYLAVDGGLSDNGDVRAGCSGRHVAGRRQRG